MIMPKIRSAPRGFKVGTNTTKSLTQPRRFNSQRLSYELFSISTSKKTGAASTREAAPVELINLRRVAYLTASL